MNFEYPVTKCCLLAGGDLIPSHSPPSLAIVRWRPARRLSLCLVVFTARAVLSARGTAFQRHGVGQCCYERYYPLENTRIYVRIPHAEEYGHKYVRKRTPSVLWLVTLFNGHWSPTPKVVHLGRLRWQSTWAVRGRPPSDDREDACFRRRIRVFEARMAPREGDWSKSSSLKGEGVHHAP